MMLGLWTNGTDFVIAEDIDDARVIIRENYDGEKLSDEEVDCEGWRQYADGEQFVMVDPYQDWIWSKVKHDTLPSGAVISARAPAKAWVKKCGRGWLASTEW